MVAGLFMLLRTLFLAPGSYLPLAAAVPACAGLVAFRWGSRTIAQKAPKANLNLDEPGLFWFSVSLASLIMPYLPPYVCRFIPTLGETCQWTPPFPNPVFLVLTGAGLFVMCFSFVKTRQVSSS